ncbi:MAG: recombinase RecT, partial [Candidatus Cloacimonetes bacterium]|nr:recombinase RecT [Candidatus Cloacimonadota bacterium]
MTKNVITTVREMLPEFKKAIGDELKANRFVRTAITELKQNPKLMKCSQMSLLGALMQVAQYKLQVGYGAYVIPYYNRKKNVSEAQFQFSYKGLIDLFYRHQKTKSVNARVVYENDQFEFEYGTDKYLKHRPTFSNRGDIKYFYAVAILQGTKEFAVMTKQEIDEWREMYAKSSDVWDRFYIQMAKKTVLKNLIKFLPLSIDQQEIIQADETVKYYNPETDFEEEPDRMDYDAKLDDEFAKLIESINKGWDILDYSDKKIRAETKEKFGVENLHKLDINEDNYLKI